MRILVGCECSGIVRNAFIEHGHEAWSCDLLPTESEGPHYQCDVRDVLSLGWDIAIFHPDCTYLTNSAAWAYGDGPYHQRIKPGTLVGTLRRTEREKAISFVYELMNAPIPRIAIENPIGILSTRIRKPDQIIQPYCFGHDASKATCLWLKNLPHLVETAYVKPRIVKHPSGEEGFSRPRWANQTDSGQNRVSPSDNRWLVRARTYPGIAEAMAAQWGEINHG